MCGSEVASYFFGSEIKVVDSMLESVVLVADPLVLEEPDSGILALWHSLDVSFVHIANKGLDQLDVVVPPGIVFHLY